MVVTLESFKARIESFGDLEKDWFDGYRSGGFYVCGEPYDKNELKWIIDLVISTKPDDIPFPHATPSPEPSKDEGIGDIIFDWETDERYASCSVYFADHTGELFTGYYHESPEECELYDVDFNDAENVQKMWCEIKDTLHSCGVE